MNGHAYRKTGRKPRKLHEVRAATGLPISEAFKAGLRSLQHQLKSGKPARSSYDIY